MAVEPRRGCGYRKIGGLYLCSGGGGVPCDRLPIRLDVCPVCSHGFKQTRGWTWVDLFGLVGGNHEVNGSPCSCRHGMPMSVGLCPLCHDVKQVGKAGLLWIEEKFYKTTGDFMGEGDELGFSRRISAIPRNFKVGKTWVMLAHPKTIRCEHCGGDGFTWLGVMDRCSQCKGQKYIPGIFTLWRPARIEKIFPESWKIDPSHFEELQTCVDQGITPVFVPDNDPDHQGTVYDKEEEEEASTVEKST